MIALRAGRVITPLRTISPAHILVADGRIVALGLPSQVPIPTDAEIIEVADKCIVPGFIDTHTHGRDGIYFGEDTVTTAELCRSIVRTGVTALLPTLSSLSPVPDTLAMILARIATVRQVMLMPGDGAEILGIHMEGPYLSGADSVKGSQRAENLRRPTVDELHRMVEAAGGCVRKMSIAPELDGALDVIRSLAQLDSVPCAAHSAASYEQTLAAVEAGLSCAAHVFNGMLPFHHRRPGLLGAILTCDRIHAELIADGEHVSTPAMQVLVRCKGVGGIHLVTDNTRWAGMANGTYADGGRTIVKEDARVFISGGALIGSVAPMDACVRNMLRLAGCSMAEAVQMATLNPARVIGADDRKGSLEPGKDADMVVIDENVNVLMTMVRGSVLY